MNIVHIWLKDQKERYGRNQTQALEIINLKLEANYSCHRLSEWKSEKRSLPKDVANFILSDVVYYVARNGGPYHAVRLPVPAKEAPEP